MNPCPAVTFFYIFSSFCPGKEIGDGRGILGDLTFSCPDSIHHPPVNEFYDLLLTFRSTTSSYSSGIGLSCVLFFYRDTSPYAMLPTYRGIVCKVNIPPTNSSNVVWCENHFVLSWSALCVFMCRTEAPGAVAIFNLSFSFRVLNGRKVCLLEMVLFFLHFCVCVYLLEKACGLIMSRLSSSFLLPHYCFIGQEFLSDDVFLLTVFSHCGQLVCDWSVSVVLKDHVRQCYIHLIQLCSVLSTFYVSYKQRGNYVFSAVSGCN